MLKLGAIFTLILASALMTGFQNGAKAQAPGEAMAIQKIRVGVLASEGATRALEAWTPTIKLLNASAEAQGQSFRFLLQPETPTSLTHSIDTRSIDMILTDPAAFVTVEVESRARAILSVAYMWNGETIDQTGSLVFTKSGSNIRTLSQLADRSVMAVAQTDFAGWWLAEQEFRKFRLEPRGMLGSLFFSGGNEREVVYAVQSGLVDAGVVRAGVLEGLARQGIINDSDFSVVSPVSHPGYPFKVSTPLYPGWVISALPNVPEKALGLVINTLLPVLPDSDVSKAASGAVFQAPQNYQSVHDLLISLRIRPYENYIYQAATRIYKVYRTEIFGVLALICLSLAFLIYELRKNIQLNEIQRNVLKSEVRSREFYRSAVEEHTVFCMLTRDGTISHVNQHFLKISDHKRQSIIDKHITTVLTPEDHAVLANEVMASMGKGVPWSGAMKLVKSDGTAAWVQCTFIPVTGISDQLSEVAMVATDVTKTREGVSEDRFQDTLELIQDQVVVMSPGSLNLLYCNGAAEALFMKGRTPKEWVGKRAGDFISRDDLKALEMRCAALIEGPQRRITWEVLVEKTEKTYEISLEYVQPNGESPRFIAMYRDISERKVAEKAKKEFIATVSHELRTPLTSMKGALGLVLSGKLGETPEKVHKLISMAGSSCDRLVLLINDILDLEKIEAGKMDFKMEIVDLVALVQNTKDANLHYAKNFNLTIRAEVGDVVESCTTAGDKGRLQQVMDNLVSNACKFSNKGSEVVLTLIPLADRHRISVRDYGSGIPAAAQSTIFNKFTQADSSDSRAKGGTGLGLSITKLIVEHHKGQVFFVSNEGDGTEFFVDLPKAEGDDVTPFALDGASVADFSDSAQDTEVGSIRGQLAESVLLEKAQKHGAVISSEFGRVNTQQVVKARGVVSQSSVLKWLDADKRTFLKSLYDRELCETRDVLIVEIATDVKANLQDRAGKGGCAKLIQDWLTLLSATSSSKAHKPSSIAVVTDAQIKKWVAENGYVAVETFAEAIMLAENDKYDVIVQFEMKSDMGITSITPLTTSEHFPDLPMTIVITRDKAEKVERGVVSKFSSGDGRARSRQAVS
jgi:PAS domain S-box-containing protein